MKFFKNNFVVGITSGLVAAVIAPMLIPALKKGSRPMAKGLIKGGMLLYEKGREVTAHAGEMMEDVMAEIQAEQAAKQASVTPEDEWEEQGRPSGTNSTSQLRPVAGTSERPSDQTKH